MHRAVKRPFRVVHVIFRIYETFSVDVIKCITGWWKEVRSVYEGGEKVVRCGFEGEIVDLTGW